MTLFLGIILGIGITIASIYGFLLFRAIAAIKSLSYNPRRKSR